MKKAIALVLALMLCLSLCACGSGASTPEEAVETAFALYDNVEDMYAAIGIDIEASLPKMLIDEYDNDVWEAKSDMLDEFPAFFGIGI